MRKILRRRLPLHQIVVTTIVGVLAGVYIWQPAIKQYVADHPEVARGNSDSKKNSSQPDSDSDTSDSTDIDSQKQN